VLGYVINWVLYPVPTPKRLQGFASRNGGGGGDIFTQTILEYVKLLFVFFYVRNGSAYDTVC
jgi:hypothetical protein